MNISSDTRSYEPFLQSTSYQPAWITFALILCWKFGLFAIFSLPIPANDAAFYDTPVINYLLIGSYTNPTIADNFPISATYAFSAYPPLHEACMLIWMSVFGTSVMAAMAFHQLLLAGTMVLTLSIFSALRISVYASIIGLLFFAGITWHDRPDTLAFFLTYCAICCYVNGRQCYDKAKSPWYWASAFCLFLVCSTSLQGGLFSAALIGTALLLDWFTRGAPLPWIPYMTGAALTLCCIFSVQFFRPDLWAGFLEHASITPSLPGARIPSLDLSLRLIRAAPGTLLCLPILFLGFILYSRCPKPANHLPFMPLLISCVTASIFAMFLLVISSMWINFVQSIQPLCVGFSLAYLLPSIRTNKVIHRALLVTVAGTLFFFYIRAVGLSTWGIVCAFDVNRSHSLQIVDAELANCDAGGAVVVSSAFIYGALRHKNLTLIHSDWANCPSRESYYEGLLRIQPTLLILTHLDYFRKYRSLLESLQQNHKVSRVDIIHAGRIPSPDSIEGVGKVLQHISWAPVVVKIKWPPL